jgi:hypothetical protein
MIAARSLAYTWLWFCLRESLNGIEAVGVRSPLCSCPIEEMNPRRDNLKINSTPC